ncbi:BON domain-containing protein [Halomonas sp. MCCC 1A17488]|uniref:BON domain-containing protein n=1 Tax=unclassified Halomonas TaxID=2609666 RepID=UPI0018D244D7|nr:MULTISPECIES: BON domain-containing protein [unclassified Halomonas]MCE8014636.1 BON domain-containing protein [Halomonas sp. MCCC 1A17488]MCG3237969.1 BON domain-containing protein [Halomonas sp. MCCC 1A17488]QPP48248.1 BON domain-containing protein [Halomonas sp. SS10-MC5]
MTSTRLFACLLATLALALGGCTAVTGVTNPGTIDENYGRRTLGAQVEDESIETKIAHNLRRSDARLGDARINVDSYNGIVLLTGQVPSEELKEKANEVAREVRNVRDVHNELSVAANLPASQRLSDTWINTRIRTTLAADESIDTGRLRFITENATVYIMGMVTRAEADRIVNAVADVGGIQRIVKVFDYLD